MVDLRLPNLFIVGAPKCGTSALSHYLSGHPQIFMTEEVGVKEPDFYSTDREIPWRPISSAEDYWKLFSGAPVGMKYLGEASTSYLESQVAIPRLLASCPTARLIVMVRNPIEVATALHNQRAKVGKDIHDFETAWKLQEVRLQGRKLPGGWRYSRGDMLQYGRIARLGEQLERVFAAVPRGQVHVIVYDDFVSDPGSVYRSLLQWLDVPDDCRDSFPPINVRLEFRSVAIERWLQRANRIRKFLRIPGGWGVHRTINHMNLVERRSTLSPEFRGMLCEYFRDDVERLSSLLGRDLTSWLESSS